MGMEIQVRALSPLIFHPSLVFVQLTVSDAGPGRCVCLISMSTIECVTVSIVHVIPLDEVSANQFVIDQVMPNSINS